ncbi:hypothetical protein ABPG74_014224 [Tetrahymena malaccensis]
MSRNHMQVLAPLASQRSYRDIRQRQNGLQQIIQSSNNSSFLNNSTAHTRNNSAQSSNLASNNQNHIQMHNSIHQISHKPQPNTQNDRRRNNSQYLQVSNQEFSSNEAQNDKILVSQQNIPLSQDRNQKLKTIQKNQSTEQIDTKSHLQKSVHPNSDQYGKQMSHQRVSSECDSEQNKENISFCVNSVQSNTQRNYSYETSFNSKTIQPEKNYFMPLKQQQQMQKQIRRNTNMSTDFSNHNNSQRQTTNSQNNSGSYNQNLNSYNSNQINQSKKSSDGLGKLLTSQLNDSTINNNIIESYIEKVFQKDLQLQNEQGCFQTSQGQSKETEQSFNQLNLQSEHSQAYKSLNQSNYNSDSSIQDKRTQQQSQIQSQLQSQILYEQALQQKLKLLPQSKENKNTTSFTQIPKPFNKFQEQSAYSQAQLKHLNKYLFGDNQELTQITKIESHQIPKQQEEVAKKLINHKELTQKTLQSEHSSDEIEQNSLSSQQEKEIIGQQNHSKQNENQKDHQYRSYDSTNQIQNNSSIYNQNNLNQSQQDQLKTQNQNLLNKISELEQKQSELQQTLIQKVMQINFMESQINQQEKDKKLMQQTLDQIQQQLSDEIKKQQELKLDNESLQEINQKQIKNQQDLNLQIQQLSFQIFQLEQQLYDVNVNAKEKEKALEQQKSEQILLLKDKFEKDFQQLNEQHSKLVQLQNVCMKQKETLQNENQLLHSQLEQYQNQIQLYQTKISTQENEIKDLEQRNLQSNSSNQQIQFIEQQLADTESELNSQNKKFNMVVLNISTVLELIQQKIQNFQTTIKMTDRSINFQNLSEQLMCQVKFGINQMALLIQPIIQEAKEQSQVQSTFRQNTSLRNLQETKQATQASFVVEDKRDQIQINKKIEVKNSNGIQEKVQVENKVNEQIDLKNVQTAQFGEENQISQLNQRGFSENQQKQEMTKYDSNLSQNDFKIQNCDSIGQLIINQSASNQEYIIPQSDTQIQIQNIKNRIYQRQQRRKQNESSYSSNRSFSYNSNQSNKYFTVGRQNQSFQDDNSSSPFEDQHQSQI